MLKFQGKTALVTGGGTGIGQAIARKFAENGASLVIVGRRREPLDGAAADLENIMAGAGSGGTVRVFAGVDVSSEEGVNAMFDSLQGDGITVDYTINNAGVSGPVTCFPNAPLEEFKSTVAIHLTGTFWVSAQALRVMKSGGKIITISTFFTEERPLEQRPYRFRSPYTASQGAKNRLAEAMSWELTDSGIASIATNPGPVHSDRIYKTVYPKAASEFMRVSGFEEMDPGRVDAASREILPLLGEGEEAARAGIADAAKKLGGSDGLEGTLARLLAKIQNIAEKVQSNTARMIANGEFLGQGQVAESVLNLCDDDISRIINGRVIPGDRVFYPVRPHVGTRTPQVHKQDLAGRAVVLVADPTDMADAGRIEFLAGHVEGAGGKAACLISESAPTELRQSISQRVHSHTINTGDRAEIERWLGTAAANLGKIACVVHATGRVPEFERLTGLSRAEWDRLVEKFITRPATTAQAALEHFVPGGAADPRLYRGAGGAVMLIGPDLPADRKTTGIRRAQIEVFRGALRPFTTTVNQELSDVLKSDVRMITVLPGTVSGAEPKDDNIARALDFLISGGAVKSSEVTFCVDESR